ncbi:MAG: FAD-dependent oxidoreductase [Sedimentitalea sp.]
MTKTLIIGGGAIGLSLAYHLTRRGEEVVLFERHQLTSGTSWHAAGIVGPLRATPSMTKLAMYAGELFPQLEDQSGLSTGYHKTGGYWLARAPERMDELHRIASLGRHFGLSASVISPDQIKVPGLKKDGLVGALAVEEDANVNPVDLCMAYAKCARSQGARIREHTEVAKILHENQQINGVQLADGSHVLADQVALCAGAWSAKLAADAGVALPLQAVEHMYVVTQPIADLPAPYPVLRDLDRGIYVKGDAGKLVIGGFEPNAKCWDAHGPEGDRAFLEMPEDWDQFAPFMEAALNLLPVLETTGIQHFMNGPESFTTDTRPLIGQTNEVDGLFVAAGMNSVGVMSSAGIGRVLADWIIEGAAPMDLWEVDSARIDPATAAVDHVQIRMQEAVSDTFALHWPFKQPKAGRGLRKSVLHHRWAGLGAQFGLTAGWERALWYAQDAGERDLPYSVGAQPWFEIIRRETAQMQTGTALIDLSPFGKFDITGPDALELTQFLCAGDVDVAPGRAVYTPMLNENGGIEADVTVVKLSSQHFRITSGAATRAKDHAWLRRHARAHRVSVEDLTEQEAVIGVMGAGARHVLASVSDSDWFDFAFSTCRDVRIQGHVVRATRISFVGELGWELTIPKAQAEAVFDALHRAGGAPLGHCALESCRVEKGFKHWGHDIGPQITPLEAGLGFTIGWDTEFLGKAALLAQKAAGISRRLVLFELPDNPLILHDEPIWEAGRVIGLTTSGARGARTGKTLAFGLINIANGGQLSQICERDFEIEVAGKRYRAIPLRHAPYDPKNERMKA